MVDIFSTKRDREDQAQRAQQSKNEAYNYEKYKSYYDAYGFNAPLSPDEYYRKAAGWADVEGGVAGMLETDLYPKVAQKYNDAVRQNAEVQGQAVDPNALMITQYDYSTQGDWRGKGADWLAGKIGAINSQATNYLTATADYQKQHPVDP